MERRKVWSTARQPPNKIKKTKLDQKAKAELEQKKVPLKTIFKKIRNGEDGSSIYMIKDVNEAPKMSEIADAKAVIPATNDIVDFVDFPSNATTICTQMHDFTTEDIAALIECSDLAALFNFTLSCNDICDDLFGPHTSTPVNTNLTTIDDFTRPKSNLPGPSDQFAGINETQNSTLTSHSVPTTQILKNDETLSACMAPTICSVDEYNRVNMWHKQCDNLEPNDDNGVRMTRNQCDNPESVEHGFTMTSNQCENLEPNDDNGVSMTRNKWENPYLDEHGLNMTHNQWEIPAENSVFTNSQKMWMADNGFTPPTSCSTTRFEGITSNERHAERFVQVKQKNYSPVPPTKVLEEILGPRKLTPSYRLRSISNTIFQCYVDVKGLYAACGTGPSERAAKNAAALSLLDKLVTIKYFGNVVGRLQEYCTTSYWPLPKYTDELAFRPRILNEDVFIVGCSVNQYREFGQGRSKKMAKIFAAYKMLYKLTGKS